MISSPEDRKKLLGAITEISNSMTRIAAEKDFQKDAIADIAEKLELEKKYVRKLATIYHKQNFSEVQAEQEELFDLYELITGVNSDGQES
jgi:archaellum component FlaC